MAFGGHIIWARVFTLLKRKSIRQSGSCNYEYKEFLYTFNPSLSRPMKFEHSKSHSYEK